MCHRIVIDGVVSDSEMSALNSLGELVGNDSPFAISARTDAFRAMYLIAVSDHELSLEEEDSLGHIRERLAVPQDAIREELAFLEQLKEVRRIRSGEVAPIPSTHKLPNGELCYFQGEGRLLKERQLKSYSQGGQRYKVRGLVEEKEGTLLITNKRVLLIHSGTTTVKHDKILDVDVDVDEGVVRITKDGSTSPTIFSTPNALQAAALIEALSGGD